MALALELVAFRPKRRIGGFVATVTLEEDASDELTITRHPVEQGARISDHAIKEPAQVTIRAGWSNATLSGLISAAGQLLSGGGAGGLFGSDYVREIYAKLLKLQSDREPFEVVTGKRKYQNMLLRSLRQTTDQTTENVLVVTATFEEIIIVETQAATLPVAERQAEPEKTDPPQPMGTKQLAPAPEANRSALKVLEDLKSLQTQSSAGN